CRERRVPPSPRFARRGERKGLRPAAPSLDSLRPGAALTCGPMKTHAELFARPRILREDLPGGGMILRSEVPLPPLARSTGVWLQRWAAEAPERAFLAERDGAGGWRRVSYREAYRDARAIGQALVDRGLGAAHPLMILSENSIDHALLTLGALEA